MKILAHSKDHRSNELITYQFNLPTYLLPEILYWKNKMEITWNSKKYEDFIKNLSTMDIFEVEDIVKGVNNIFYNSRYNFDLDFVPNNVILNLFSNTLVTLTSSKPALMEFFDKCCPKYEFEIPLSMYDNVAWDKQIFKSKRSIPISKDDNKILWENINQNKSTDIHLQQIAEQMYDLYNESDALELKEGEWHIPIEDDILNYTSLFGIDLVKISIGLLNTNLDINKLLSANEMTAKHNQLLKNNELDTFIHCAKVMTDDEYNGFSKSYYQYDYEKKYYEGDIVDKGCCENYKGFISYKFILNK